MSYFDVLVVLETNAFAERVGVLEQGIRITNTEFCPLSHRCSSKMFPMTSAFYPFHSVLHLSSYNQ